MTIQALAILRRGNWLQSVAKFLLRYGLVLIVAWIGAMKFTAYEAAGIQPLVSSSPLMSWMYNLLKAFTNSNIRAMNSCPTSKEESDDSEKEYIIPGCLSSGNHL